MVAGETAGKIALSASPGDSRRVLSHVTCRSCNRGEAGALFLGIGLEFRAISRRSAVALARGGRDNSAMSTSTQPSKHKRRWYQFRFRSSKGPTMYNIIPGSGRVKLLLALMLVGTLAAPVAGQPKLRKTLGAAAVKKVRPSIVVIQGIKKQERRNDAKKSVTAGVGVIVDRRGIIVTAHHVIEGLENIKIVLSDGRKLAAHSVVSNRRADLAIVKVKAAIRLPCAQLGDSDKSDVGDPVLMIGSAFGDEISVTLGIVSVMNRATKDGKPLLGLDFSIGPAPPTGPVVNLNGRVIGLVVRTSKQGIPLAMPSNRVKEILAELIDEKVARARWQASRSSGRRCRIARFIANRHR